MCLCVCSRRTEIVEADSARSKWIYVVKRVSGLFCLLVQFSPFPPLFFFFLDSVNMVDIDTIYAVFFYFSESDLKQDHGVITLSHAWLLATNINISLEKMYAKLHTYLEFISRLCSWLDLGTASWIFCRKMFPPGAMR